MLNRVESLRNVPTTVFTPRALSGMPQELTLPPRACLLRVDHLVLQWLLKYPHDSNIERIYHSSPQFQEGYATLQVFKRQFLLWKSKNRSGRRLPGSKGSVRPNLGVGGRFIKKRGPSAPTMDNIVTVPGVLSPKATVQMYTTEEWIAYTDGLESQLEEIHFTGQK